MSRSLAHLLSQNARGEQQRLLYACQAQSPAQLGLLGRGAAGVEENFEAEPRAAMRPEVAREHAEFGAERVRRGVAGQEFLESACELFVATPFEIERLRGEDQIHAGDELREVSGSLGGRRGPLLPVPDLRSSSGEKRIRAVQRGQEAPQRPVLACGLEPVYCVGIFPQIEVAIVRLGSLPRDLEKVSVLFGFESDLDAHGVKRYTGAGRETSEKRALEVLESGAAAPSVASLSARIVQMGSVLR